MTSRGRRLASLIEGLCEIQVRIRLVGIYSYGSFPGIHGFVGVTESRGQEAVIHEGIWIAREELEHFRVTSVRVPVPAVLKQRPGAGLLRALVVRVDVHCACQRIDGCAAVPGPALRRSDASLHSAVVWIHARRIDQSGKIRLMGTQREAKLVHSAPQKQQSDK